MVEAQLITEDIQAILVSKANIELQNIALRRQLLTFQTELIAVKNSLETLKLQKASTNGRKVK